MKIKKFTAVLSLLLLMVAAFPLKTAYGLEAGAPLSLARAAGVSTLRSISTKPAYKFSPSFSPDVRDYVLALPAGVSSVRLYAAASGRKASVRFNGKKASRLKVSVQNGASKTVRITAASQGKSAAVYTVKVVRAAKITDFSTTMACLSVPALFPDGKNSLVFTYRLKGAAKAKIQLLISGKWKTLYENKKTAVKGSFAWDGSAKGAFLTPRTYTARLVADCCGAISSKTITVNILKKQPAYTVYLSPSMQEYNRGAQNYGTEEFRMNQIADVVQEELVRCGIKVARNKPNWTLRSSVAYANSLNCHAYVAIHSNAMGKARDKGTASGCEVWAYKKGTRGAALAASIYSKMAALTPVKDRGVKYASFYETRYPKAASCIVEVDFHDNPSRAKWITENIEPIGIEIAKGICGYLNVVYIPPKEET